MTPCTPFEVICILNRPWRVPPGPKFEEVCTVIGYGTEYKNNYVLKGYPDHITYQPQFFVKLPAQRTTIEYVRKEVDVEPALVEELERFKADETLN